MRMSGVLLFQEQNLGLPKQAHFCYLQMRPLSQLSSEGKPNRTIVSGYAIL